MKYLHLLVLLTLAITARSQDKGSLYVFDANWKPTKIETAHFLLHTYRVNDTCWQWDFYNFIGPLIKSERYRDKEGTEINGVSHHYNEHGYLDSVGFFSRGRRNGDFYKLVGDTLRYKWKYIYREDSLIEVIDLENQKKDSVKLYGDEKESDYPGGSKGWQRYLLKHVTYPERAMNGNIEGQVRVEFVVDKTGTVIDPFISLSVEFSLDEESLRIISGSGKWEPAFQNAQVVKSYKQQPINFRFR